ncbi:uncharacterized protein LOC135960148 [Calliphora vicina]|uniref:uncharacterized protein LOC135960148 n=1 Tax=Calliphora vicina TaxID=7373 RepID=UPI00325C040D
MSQEQFFVHTRMSKPMFDWLLSFTKSSLNKKRQRVLAEERLVITLNYLAYGTPLQSIAFKHKLGKSTIREVVLSTCSVLWSLLSPIYLSEPTTSQYADIADDFKNKYEIPNCVGLIDGKHVSIRYRVMDKTTTYNKSNLSMILLGVCDAKYKFTAVSVENFDKKNENAIFQLSPFWNALISDNLPLPSSKPLFPSSSHFPHYFIANTSLPLRKNIMRPYVGTDLTTEKTIFNYNISRAGSVIENSFGLLTARWRVLLTTIEFLPESCKTIILACVVLHNYVMANDDDQLYCPTNFIDREGEVGNIILGEWRSELKNNGDQPLPSMATNMGKSCFEANNLRDTLANYFSNESIFYDIEL